VASLFAQLHAKTSVIYFADTHVGEGCNSSDTNYQLNDTNCYSVRDLSQTVRFINQLDETNPSLNLSMVIIGGDITSSAQKTEFIAAKRELDVLRVPYLPTMGNHDVWSYDQVIGDRTTTPIADRLFAATFAPQFKAFADRGGFSYANTTAWNSDHKCNSTFQSWTFSGDGAPNDPAADLKGVLFIAPDFNTRKKAPPPCPGHSPTGGCGVPGPAELSNFTAGVWPWFEEQLHGITALTKQVVLLTHQPFRCRPGVPDWSFCFSSSDKASIRSLLTAAAAKHPLKMDLFWGQMAGHQHRWYVRPGFASLTNSSISHISFATQVQWHCLRRGRVRNFSTVGELGGERYGGLYLHRALTLLSCRRCCRQGDVFLLHCGDFRAGPVTVCNRITDYHRL
jgi:3',5'-cyclic AMP phosphodiesterase CpdA